MRKAPKKILGILFLYQVSSISCVAATDHLANLKSKYPYGLLNNDHGVLTENDLALNACYIKPVPLVLGALNPYEYWLCFGSGFVTPICEDQGFSNEDGRVGRVAVDAKSDATMYHFIESRPWPIRDCRRFAKELKNVMRGTSHACISASYIGKEEVNEKGRMEHVGIFHRLKTKNGCEGEECTLTEKLRREICPDLKS